MTRFDFQGSRVLVTGASRGIGRAIALAFGAAGARLAVHFQGNAEAARATLEALPGAGHRLVQVDLAEVGAGRRLVAEVVEHFDGLDVLVNNAGIFLPHPPLASSAGEWDSAWAATLRVNLTAVAETCHAAAPHLGRSGGRIVNVSSRGAFRGEPDAPAYGASKAGLNALSQSLAKALAPVGVAVFVVAPGWVETDMAAPWLAGPEGEAVRQQSPLGRVATPEEIANAVLFFASPGNESMTGAILDVNGASYLRT